MVPCLFSSKFFRSHVALPMATVIVADDSASEKPAEKSLRHAAVTERALL
jgi:hypothetical protein